MTYKQIKWMILIVPTLTVGIWEYVRHQFLMPYISMTAGNYLTPIILFMVSVTLLAQLFKILERYQEELNQERAVKATLEAREQLARELHDGIAQSLFLLSVKIDRLERKEPKFIESEDLHSVRKTVHEVNRYVRQAIANLRYNATSETVIAGESMRERVEQLVQETHIRSKIDWRIPDSSLSPNEKVEMLACIREALLNIQKHAKASEITVSGQGEGNRWTVQIEDNGVGFEGDPFGWNDRYGLKIMKERAEEMNWHIAITSVPGKTTVTIEKGESS
ncbi:histidine kinase [Paenibacillus sediminis]|uniref:histidine kinase n=1 Tax=Paenibacillus sediminis TaxID=664909 RepID=A0ABS4H197_9BACL|nr:histidine kinase [Paenibacillus sediminis]MBP1936304.1 two-component system nitrate/nitrite sensor histidine kinase NarQ [Paenibacillus sediminis]